ncbi:hypothetical protein FrEUN1fDRAFT_3379 [Parafrankia sp. EUN1f]|nr:hypothetical protein FrEUN1fDRAFT_3379 [Parafrankia sp. EUN1f]
MSTQERTLRAVEKLFAAQALRPWGKGRYHGGRSVRVGHVPEPFG